MLLIAAAALLASCTLAPRPAAAMLTASQIAQWQQYMQERHDLSIKSQPLNSSLGSVFDHGFRTPLDAVLASNVYTGSNSRLRRVISDLTAAKPVKIVAIGGLATNGSDASNPGKNDYFAQYIAYLAKAFPGASIKPVRASAGLAPSAIVAGCLDRFLPSDADLVILEMSANDGVTMDSSVVNARQPRAYEVLVRKILNGDKKPALLLTQVRSAPLGFLVLVCTLRHSSALWRARVRTGLCVRAWAMWAHVWRWGWKQLLERGIKTSSGMNC